MQDKLPAGINGRYQCADCGYHIVTLTIHEGMRPDHVTCPVCNVEMPVCSVEPDDTCHFVWFKPKNLKVLKKQCRWEMKWCGYEGVVTRRELIEKQFQRVKAGWLLLAPTRFTVEQWENE